MELDATFVLKSILKVIYFKINRRIKEKELKNKKDFGNNKIFITLEILFTKMIKGNLILNNSELQIFFFNIFFIYKGKFVKDKEDLRVIYIIIISVILKDKLIEIFI